MSDGDANDVLRAKGEDAVREPAEETESVVGSPGQRANMIFVPHIAIVS